MKCERCDEVVPQGRAERLSMWHKIRATNEGWFFTKDGKAYCPAHIPDWVQGWKESKKG